MKTLRLIIASLASGIVLASFAGESIEKEQRQRQIEWTRLVAKKINETLTQLDRSCAEAAAALTTENLASPSARAVLKEVVKKNSFVENVGTISPEGRIIAVYPDRYKRVEGSDITHQAHVQKMLARRKPVLSGLFRAVEGFPVVALQHPIKTKEGTFRGAVSAIFRPEKAIRQWVEDIRKETPYDFWVMQDKGEIIFDFDTEEIGCNLFTDPRYKRVASLQNLAKNFPTSKEGSGDYDFFCERTRKTLKKTAVWKEIDLQGSVWYVVLTRPIEEPEGTSLRRSPADLGMRSAEDNLKQLAKDATFIAALERADTVSLQNRLEAFYKANPGIYVVELTDAKGVVRYAHPRGNAVIGYDAGKGEWKFDQACMKALREKVPARVQQSLLEGGTGDFVLEPVVKDEKALGVLYFIRLVTPQ